MLIYKNLTFKVGYKIYELTAINEVLIRIKNLNLNL